MSNGGGHCRQPDDFSYGLHTAAPTAAFFTGSTLGVGSPPRPTLPPRAHNPGPDCLPCLAPLLALDPGGGATGVTGWNQHKSPSPAHRTFLGQPVRSTTPRSMRKDEGSMLVVVTAGITN